MNCKIFERMVELTHLREMHRCFPAPAYRVIEIVIGGLTKERNCLDCISHQNTAMNKTFCTVEN